MIFLLDKFKKGILDTFGWLAVMFAFLCAITAIWGTSLVLVFSLLILCLGSLYIDGLINKDTK